MVGGFDALLDFLGEKISLCGDKGATIKTIKPWTCDFYEDTRSSSAPSPVVDDALVTAVWTWLKDEDGLICVQKKVDSVLANQTTSDGGSDHEMADDTSGPGIGPVSYRDEYEESLSVSEERAWRAIAGHDIDHKRLPASSFRLLSIIAARGKSGIYQPELVRSSGQDKRSVPQRTDQLNENGYILKKKVTWRKAATSWVVLRKFVSDDEPPPTDSSSRTRTVTTTAKEIVSFLEKQGEGKAVTALELRESLGVVAQRLSRNTMNHVLLHMSQLGWLRLLYSSKGARISLLASITLLRLPSNSEYLGFEKSYRQQERNSNLRSANVNMAIYHSDDGPFLQPHTTESDLDPETSSMVEMEPSTGVGFGTWRPELPTAIQYFERVASNPYPGVDAHELARQTGFLFARKSQELLLSRLTDSWTSFQPPHLRRFAVVRDTVMRSKNQIFIYRSQEAHQKAVDQGLTTWEAVGLRGKLKGPVLDEWGFRPLPRNEFQVAGSAIPMGVTYERARLSAVVEPSKQAITSAENVIRADRAASSETEAIVKSFDAPSDELRVLVQALPKQKQWTDFLAQTKLLAERTLQYETHHRGSVGELEVANETIDPLRRSQAGGPNQEGEKSIEQDTPNDADRERRTGAQKPTTTAADDKSLSPLEDSAMLASETTGSLKRALSSNGTPTQLEITTPGLLNQADVPNPVANDQAAVILSTKSLKRPVPDDDTNAQSPGKKQKLTNGKTSPASETHDEAIARLQIDFLLLKRPGVYINPPPRLNHVRGRPKRRLILVIKFDGQRAARLADIVSREQQVIPQSSIQAQVDSTHLPSDIDTGLNGSGVVQPSTPTCNDDTSEEMHSAVPESVRQTTRYLTRKRDEEESVTSNKRPKLHRQTTHEDSKPSNLSASSMDLFQRSSEGKLKKTAMHTSTSAMADQDADKRAVSIEPSHDTRYRQRSPMSAQPGRIVRTTINTASRHSRRNPASRNDGKLRSTDVRRGGGTIGFQRRGIVLRIINRNGGVYPGEREIGAAFASEWRVSFGDDTVPDALTAASAIKHLVDSGVLRRHYFTVANREGVTKRRSVVSVVGTAEEIAKVTLCQQRMAKMHPKSYIPELHDTEDDSSENGVQEKLPPAQSIDLNAEQQARIARWHKWTQARKETVVDLREDASGRDDVQSRRYDEFLNAKAEYEAAKLEKLLFTSFQPDAEAYGIQFGELKTPDYLHDPESIFFHQHERRRGVATFRTRSSTWLIGRDFNQGTAVSLTDPEQTFYSINGTFSTDFSFPYDFSQDVWAFLNDPNAWSHLQTVSQNMNSRTTAPPHPMDSVRYIEKWELRRAPLPGPLDTMYKDPFVTITMASKTTPSMFTTYAANDIEASPGSEAAFNSQSAWAAYMRKPMSGFTLRGARFGRNGRPWGPGRPRAAFSLSGKVRARGRGGPVTQVTNYISEADAYSIIAAVVVIQTITGRSLQTLNWHMVARNFYRDDEKVSDYEVTCVKRMYETIRAAKGAEIKVITSSFQRAFLSAYEKREVPVLDLSSPKDYPWDIVIDWAHAKISSWVAPPTDVLPASRKAFDEHFMTERDPNAQQKPPFKTSFTTMQLKKMALLHSPSWVPMRTREDEDIKEHERQPESRRHLEVAKSYIRALVMTPDDTYSASRGKQSIMQFGEDYIDTAMGELIQGHVLNRIAKMNDIKGRNFVLNHTWEKPFVDNNLPGFRRIYADADSYKRYLDTRFDRNNPERSARDLSFHVRDGEAMALVELIIGREVSVDVMVPAPTSDMSQRFEERLQKAPMAIFDSNRRLSIWGFSTAEYKSMHVEQAFLVFPMRILPTPNYGGSTIPGLDGVAGDKLPAPPSLLAGVGAGRIPMWIDINGAVVSRVWSLVLGSVTFLLAFRPGIDVVTIRHVLGAKSITESELHAVLRWLLRSGLIRWSESIKGWVVERGWWSAVSETMTKDMELGTYEKKRAGVQKRRRRVRG